MFILPNWKNCTPAFIAPQFPIQGCTGIREPSGKWRKDLQSPPQCSLSRHLVGLVGQPSKMDTTHFASVEGEGGNLNVSPLTAIISSLGFMFYKTV